MNNYVILFIFGVFISSCAQVMLKVSAGEKHKSVTHEYLNIKVLGSYVIFFIAAFLNVIALKGIYVKNAPVLEALGYIFILIMSSLILKEKLTKRKVFGNLIIIIGIFIFNL